MAPDNTVSMSSSATETIPSRRSGDRGLPSHVSVVVVGAGLSGIGAGYRLQTQCPGRDYVILEARDTLGGTWDLFRYPGIRSDSDMFTLAYPFRPWREEASIVDGSSILSYLRRCAVELGVEEHVRYGHKVVAASFATDTAVWTLTLERRTPEGVERAALTCDFLYSCTGYYDYETPHAPDFPGVESFTGRLVHPQFWPPDLDYAGKRVVVIGSGATAVTLVPAMVRPDAGHGAAAHVTMLQRTPTWMASIPSRDALATRLREHLPAVVADKLVRAKNVALSTALYEFCRRRPMAARRLLLRLVAGELNDAQTVADHFTPSYDPWDQRLCAVPDGDFFTAMRAGVVDVVTDSIAEFVPAGIRLRSGRTLDADIVVTATGLRLLALGGVTLRVDGRCVALSDQFVWRGAMITGLPNFAMCMGYPNASWTLRADLTSRLVCRVLAWMEREEHACVVPQPRGELTPRPLLDLAAGYIRRSIDILPRQGHRPPWRMRHNYLLDMVATMHSDLGRSLRATPRRREDERRATRQARRDEGSV